MEMKSAQLQVNELDQDQPPRSCVSQSTEGRAMTKTSRAKRVLTWAPNWKRAGGRWKKQIDGKVWFFGHADSPTDARAYKNALQNYLDFLQRQKRQAIVEVPISKASVRQVCEKLLQRDLERYERGEITANSVNRLRACLEIFIDFVGSDIAFSQINE